MRTIRSGFLSRMDTYKVHLNNAQFWLKLMESFEVTAPEAVMPFCVTWLYSSSHMKCNFCACFQSALVDHIGVCTDTNKKVWQNKYWWFHCLFFFGCTEIGMFAEDRPRIFKIFWLQIRSLRFNPIPSQIVYRTDHAFYYMYNNMIRVHWHL